MGFKNKITGTFNNGLLKKNLITSTNVMYLMVYGV